MIRNYFETKHYVINTFSVPYSEEMFCCPNCEEPILNEDWHDDEVRERCPICGFNWLTEEVEDDMI